jgi:signal peptide peptidase SppA
MGRPSVYGHAGGQKAGGGLMTALLDRFYNSPLALWPGQIAPVLEMLRDAPRVRMLGAQALDTLTQTVQRPYDLIEGVAIIPVTGVLVHGYTGWCWNETDYARIDRMFDAAINDPEVRAIAMHVNSPGGEVAGCFDLAEKIHQMRNLKTIVAILDEYAFSAAYALASAAEKIVVPRTGGTGSIGVITMHVDVTKALEKMGITVTTVQYGSRKSDSYPTTPLSEEARARIQQDIDTMGELFVEIVARNRGIAAAKVRATEAGCFLGADGVEQGLADGVMSPDEAFLSLIEEIS